MKSTLLSIFNSLAPVAMPYIREMIRAKFMPMIVRKSYEALDNMANKLIERLLELKTKIDETPAGVKKDAHIAGLKLGAATLKAIGEKLIKAAEAVQE